jgi:hypothetical protein
VWVGGGGETGMGSENPTWREHPNKEITRKLHDNRKQAQYPTAANGANGLNTELVNLLPYLKTSIIPQDEEDEAPKEREKEKERKKKERQREKSRGRILLRWSGGR